MPIYQNLSIQSITLTQFTKNSPIFLIPIFASAACSFDFSKLSFSNSFQSFLYANNFKEIYGKYSQFSHFLNSVIKTENRETNCTLSFWEGKTDVYLMECSFNRISGSAISSENSTLRMFSCNFYNTYAQDGGAVFHTNGYLSSNACNYHRCRADNKGGGIFHDTGPFYLYRSSFLDTSAAEYTAFYANRVPLSNPSNDCFVIEQCYFNTTSKKSLWYVTSNVTNETVIIDLEGAKFNFPEKDLGTYVPNYTMIRDPHVKFSFQTVDMRKSRSNFFTPTTEFTRTESFSSSGLFSESLNFTISNKFASTLNFSNSFYFTNSLIFSRTDTFTSTERFSLTSNFTETQNFTVSSQFSQSYAFLPSGTFSSSPAFSLSISFTESSDFSPSQSPTPKITPIPTYSPTPFDQQWPSLSGSYTTFFTGSSSFTQSSFLGGDSINGNARSSIQAKGIMILFIILLCIILLIGLIANIILCIQQIQSGEIITTQRI